MPFATRIAIMLGTAVACKFREAAELRAELETTTAVNRVALTMLSTTLQENQSLERQLDYTIFKLNEAEVMFDEFDKIAMHF